MQRHTKDVRFTRHAAAKLAERGIDPKWVERTARDPEWREPEPHDPTAERRFAGIGGYGGRYLRVVCVETDRTIRIITAVFDRGARPKP